MKSFIMAVLVALLFFLALLFGARNEQLVTISYFVAQGEYRLPVVLAVVFLLGFIISWLFAMVQIAKLKLALRRARKQLESVDTKVSKDVDA